MTSVKSIKSKAAEMRSVGMINAVLARCGADGHHAELPRGAEWIRAVTTLQHHHNTNNNSSTAVVLRVVGSGGKRAADKGTMTTFCRVSPLLRPTLAGGDIFTSTLLAGGDKNCVNG